MKSKTPLLVAVLLLLALQGFWNRTFVFDKWAKDYAPKKSLVDNTALSPDQFLFALAGFRELVAGILWVRADSFFDTGNYDAVLPMIRLVTLLDPKQIDVYSTGMWHIGYNFTDEEQRSDRRYVPSALALGKEGQKYNPETYELFFETGWIWFHKIDDQYEKAVSYFEQANERTDMLTARRNILAKAYLRNGQVQKGLDYYYYLLGLAEENLAREDSRSSYIARDTIAGNIDTVLVRMVQRGFVAKEKGYYDFGDYDTKPPFDVGFSVKATVVESRVLKIEGTWNVQPVGTRIRVVLRDADYPGAAGAQMDWDGQNDVMLDPPRDLTFMQEQLFVRNRKFNRRIDMSKDPTMYPFAKKTYLLEFYYNPRSAPDHIQDKFGWNGEGMTDKHFINTEVRPGQKVIYTSFELTKDQLLRLGPWADQVPVVKTANFVEQRLNADEGDVVVVPALRGLAKPTTPAPKTK